MQVDAETLFEAFRPQIEALVTAEVERRVSRMESAKQWPEYLTTAQAARYLGVSRDTIERRYRDKACLMGGKRMFRRADLV